MEFAVVATGLGLAAHIWLEAAARHQIKKAILTDRDLPHWLRDVPIELVESVHDNLAKAIEKSLVRGDRND